MSKNTLLDRIVATLFTKSRQSTKRQRVSSKSRLRSAAEFAGAFLLASSFFAAPASAQYGLPTFTANNTAANTTVVGFGGQQWYVISDNSTDATPTIRLLHKDSGFGSSTFRAWTGTEYEQSFNTNPNEYGDSTLQRYMETQAGALSAGEQDVLIGRSRADMTDIGNSVNFADQKLWAISYAEWNGLSAGMKRYSNDYWLRSPYGSGGNGAVVGSSGGGFNNYGVNSSLAVRPASDLNLSSVIFTSKNDGSGKDAQMVGGGWYNYNPTPAQPARDIKFTFLDAYDFSTNPTGQATPTLTLKSGMAFDFTGATMGANQYVSGLLHGAGLTDYYAKFADTSTLSTGSFTTLTTITGDGVYSFDIFCEQANGVNYSDFMGRPVQFELTVSGGTATDLTLVSTDIDFGLDGGTIGLKNGYDYTQAFTLGNTGTNTINVKTDESSTISGNMTGFGDLDKTGSGTLILTGANSLGNFTVQSGTLGGTGSVTITALTVASAAALSPGDTPGAIGTLTITGNLDLQTDSTLKLDINDTGYDTVDVSGAVSVGSGVKLNVASTRTGIFEIVTSGNAIDDTNFGSAVITATGTVDGYSLAVRGGTNKLQLSSDIQAVELVIGALQNKMLTWTGADSANWHNTGTGDENWTDGIVGGETRFMDGDAVTFNIDTATTVNVQGAQKTVAQMIVTTGFGDLTINGNIIGDASLSTLAGLSNAGQLNKTGIGTLTLNGTGRFVSDIRLDGGTTNIGTGSELSGGSTLYVGDSGTGELNLTAGGKATAADNIYLGYNSFYSGGTVNVDGTGSELKSTNGLLFVGNYGTGVLNLTDGGKATSASDINIGINAGSSGTVTVGSGSELTSTGGNIYVGGNAGNTGLLAGSGTISANGGAGTVLVFSTGTLAPGDTPTNEPGTVSPDIGTLTITGNLELQTTSTLLIDIDATSNDKIAASGAVSVGSGVKLNVATTRTGTFEIVTSGNPITDANFGDAVITATGTVDGYDLAVRGGANKLQLSSDTQAVELVIALQNKTLYWTGNVNGNWSTSATDLNWTDTPGGAATETRFLDGDTVSFTDTGSNKTVTVAAAGVSVLGMTVNNSTDNDYSFTGGTISGTGGLTKNGAGIVSFASGVYAGPVAINGGTVQIADASYNAALTGNGTFAVNLAAAATEFTFGNNLGTAFAGTVEMVKGTIALDKTDNLSVLRNAGLKLDSDAVATLNATQTIKGLNLNGGTLKIDVASITPDGVLNVTDLDVASGTIMVDLNKQIVTDAVTAQSLYDYATAASAAQQKLVGATNVTGIGTQLAWKDYGGNDLDTPQVRALYEGATQTGIATFDYLGTVENDGIHLGYGLTRIEALSNQNVTLDGSAATAATPTINAVLTGSGGFIFSGTKNVSIGNAASDYVGETTLTGAHSVTMLTDDAFGDTSSLTLSNAAKLDMAGKSQTVGSVSAASGTEIALGDLTTSTGGSIAGTLSGTGTLTQTAGLLAYSGTQNTGSFVQNGGSLQTTDGAKLNNATFKGTVTPTGVLNVASAAFDGATVNIGTGLGANQIVASGNANIEEGVTVNLNATGVTADNTYDYTLIQGTTFTGDADDATVNATLSSSQRGGHYIASNALNYQLIVGATTLTWNGNDTDNTWNNNDSNTNWTAGNISTYFKNGDAVFFTDAAANKNVVVDSGGVAVSSMTANNSADNDYTFTGGNVTGTGTLTKTGNGILTFTNDATFASTTVSGGTLQIGNGGTTGSFTGDILNNATVTFNRSNDYSYNGIISGSGIITKIGSGDFTLTGNSSGFTGATYINVGTMNVDGVLGGTTTVQSGAALGGSGTVTSAILNSGSKLAPGGFESIGELTIGGNTAFTGVELQIDLGPNNNDKLVINGTADFTGGGNTLNLTTWTNGTYTIVEATSVNGATADFNTIQYKGEALTPDGRRAASMTVSGTAISIVTQANNQDIVWTGPGTWNNDENNKIWTLNSVADCFIDLDAVTFDSTGNHSVAVDPIYGVTVADMTVSADGYVFSGGKITGDATGSMLTGRSSKLLLSGTNATTTFQSEIDFKGGIDIGATNTLVFDYDSDDTNGNAVTGGGNLEKSGFGELTFTGSVTNISNTTVSGGTLTGNIASGTNLSVNSGAAYKANGSDRTVNALIGAGDVVMSGNALTVSSGDFEGVISGDGTNLNKTSTGTLILSGNNTYTGATNIQGGTLRTESQNALASTSGITLASGTTLDLAYIGDFSKDLTGSGTLQTSGKIAITNDYDVAMTVAAAGTLTASGTYKSLSVASGGTFTPGADIATANVSTTANFASGSTYAVQIDLENDGVSDRLIAQGDITVADGAALDVTAIDGTIPVVEGYRYLVLQSTGGTISNTFSDFTFERALYRLEQDLSDPSELYLNLKKRQAEFAKMLEGLGLDNAYNTAVAVDAIDAADLGAGLGSLYDALGNLEVDADVYAAAFTQLHGEVFASSREAAAQTQRRFLRNLPSARDRALDSLCSACSPCGSANSHKKWNRWANFTGDWLSRNNIGNFSGYDLRTYGVAFGMDKNVTKKLFVGAAFGYDDATQKFDTLRSRDEMDVFRSMLYGGWRSGRTYVDGYVGYTKNWHETRRDINIGDFAGTARSKYDDDMLSTGLEIGRKLRFGRLNVTPSVGLHYIYLDSPSATETGANGANLHVSGGKYDSLRLPLGARFSRDFRMLNSMTWTPELRAFYVAELADDSASVRTSFNNVRSIGFTASSGHWGRSSGVFGVGLKGQLSDRLSLRVDYDHEVYEHTDMGEFSVSAGVNW